VYGALERLRGARVDGEARQLRADRREHGRGVGERAPHVDADADDRGAFVEELERDVVGGDPRA
jgi:hypothetical protein